MSHDAAKVESLLSAVSSFVAASPRAKDVVSLIMQEQEEWTTAPPILLLLSKRADPFLRDRAPSRLSVVVDSSSRRVALLHTHNRQLLREKVLDDLAADLAPLLDELCGDHLSACVGFACCGGEEDDEVDAETTQASSAAELLLSRVRKSDLRNLLLEKFDGRVLFRSRSCAFVVDRRAKAEEVPDLSQGKNFSSGTHCFECRRLFVELDDKYCSGRLCAAAAATEPGENNEEERSAVEVEKGEKEKEESAHRTRRGRPKRKKLMDKDFVSPGPAARHKGEEAGEHEDEENKVADNVKAEDHLSMEDDPMDEDYGSAHVRKSLRRRKSSMKVLMLMGRRKRGRPPNLTDPQTCEQCGEVFVVAKDFKQHCLEHTNTFICDFEDCSKRFKLKSELEVHTRKHLGENPFLCSECSQSFSSKPDYKLHLKSHSGPKPFKCDSCPKTFARVQQRDIHMAVHTGERAFLCPECGNSFGSVSTLIDHRKRKHLLMRDHKCAECTKGFFTRQELEAHTRTHTGDKPFFCTLCGKTFARPHHLKRHIQSVHKGVKTNRPILVVKKDKTTSSSAAATADDLGKGVVKIQETQGGGGTVFVSAVSVEGESDEEGSTFILSDMNGQLMEGEYLVNGRRYVPSVASDGTPLLIQKISSADEDDEDEDGAGSSVQYATLSGDAATSLIELSQMGGRGDEDDEDDDGDERVVVEISGEGGGLQAAAAAGYILLTSEEDGSQKLVPISEYQKLVGREESASAAEGEDDEAEEEDKD